MTPTTDIIDDILSIFLHIPFIKPDPIFLNDTQVQLLLYTRQNRKSPIIVSDNSTIEINRDRDFKFIIHGWLSEAASEWTEEMKESFLDKGDYNVVKVDWHEPAHFRYSLSSQATREVGRIVAETILKINAPLERIHIIGHSLGAHAAGFAGKIIQNVTEGKIRRITGLDPAGPMFEGFLIDGNERLNNADAERVDVIHTDAGIFGFAKPIGHIDFYPNGGNPLQRGCPDVSIANRNDIVEILKIGPDTCK